MLRIELPLPPKELSPNARVHYQVRARATREAKDEVIIALAQQPPALRFLRPRPYERATVTVTFIVPDRRNRDKGNLIGSAKPYLDGLVDAGVIADDNWKAIEEVYPPIEYQKGVRKTIIEVNP